jgi:glutamyl-tRNA synthetase
MSEIRVRIAPSPTGYLHIGTARTALFNFLFAKKYGGKFLLRIEDTDASRNTTSAYNSILNGLQFLGLQWDEDVIYQKEQMVHHVKIAKQLIQNGNAYYCYLSPEEIEKRRIEAESKGARYIHRYSKGDETPKEGIKPAIRIKVPHNLDIINEDLIQGKVVINSNTIEDFVVVRADETPVYMLSVVCDDVSMKITHVLRGDDHLTNTAKQILIYNALGEKLPLFGHIPLIHGIDGKKLSKRHGALAVEEYKNMGYLPEALRSYLVRLGWGSGNDAILDDKAMLADFGLEGISKSPARFDFEKLNNINHHFILNLSEDYIYLKVIENVTFKNLQRIKTAVSKIRYRYNKISDMQNDFIAFDEGYELTPEALEIINKESTLLHQCLEFFKQNKDAKDNIEAQFKAFLTQNNISFGKVGPVLRASLIGKTSSIGVFEIITILGINEAINRIQSSISNYKK